MTGAWVWSLGDSFVHTQIILHCYQEELLLLRNMTCCDILVNNKRMGFPSIKQHNYVKPDNNLIITRITKINTKELRTNRLWAFTVSSLLLYRWIVMAKSSYWNKLVFKVPQFFWHICWTRLTKLPSLQKTNSIKAKWCWKTKWQHKGNPPRQLKSLLVPRVSS